MHAMQKTIADLVPDRAPPTVTRDAMVSEAIGVMRAQDQHAVLVLDEAGEALVGIFTERDLLNRVAAPGKDAMATPVSEVMTASPTVLARSGSVAYAVNRMGLEGFSNVPVVDDAGRAVGLLDVWDVIAHLTDVFADLEAPEMLKDPASPWLDLGGGG